MKKTILITIISIFAWMTHTSAQTNDTVVMGASYANDVYYSLENGTIKAEPRNNWDLGFYTNRWSAGIIINDGIGVKLFVYPKGDTTAWNTIDTAGMTQWVNSYNSDTIWEDGAFNRNALGHPDYGWGVYNMINHDVVGDSVYVLQLANGSLKKIWIQRKNSIANTFYFKYADVNNQNEVSVNLDVTPYESKLFIYYSLTTQQLIDREPAKTDWDLLFSKYMGTTFDNEGNPTPYPVVGVVANVTDTISKNYPVTPDFEDWTVNPMNGDKATIGHDWKSFDMNTFSWTIADSTVYFVKNEKGDIYKFIPDYFSGSGSGKTGFVKKLLSLSSVNETATKASFVVYPNPASTRAKILLNESLNTTAQISLFDQSGRLVMQTESIINGLEVKIDLPTLRSGLYFIEINTGNSALRQKLMIQQ
ncbi:MAG: T9SS type A sorting domain-containing protein [Bacteroidales bacterium]